MINNLLNKEYSYRPMAVGAPRTFVVKMDVTFLKKRTFHFKKQNVFRYFFPEKNYLCANSKRQSVWNFLKRPAVDMIAWTEVTEDILTYTNSRAA